jgi:hypothetical protein
VSGSRLLLGIGLGVDVTAVEAVEEGFGPELGLRLGRELVFKLDGSGERDDSDGLRVDADMDGVALVVANLAAIGGKGALDTDAERGPGVETDKDDSGVDEDVDADNGKGLAGIGGTTGVGFDFRLKNDPVFFLTESEPSSALDFDDALLFLDETEEKETASERYAPSLAASVSYSVASPLMGVFDLPVSFFSFLLLLFFTFSSFLASFLAAFASFSASFAALASVSFLTFSFSFALFPRSLTYPSLSYPLPLFFTFLLNLVPELCFKTELAEMDGAIVGKGIGRGEGDGVISDCCSMLVVVLALAEV